jgi:hypothetical protein
MWEVGSSQIIVLCSWLKKWIGIIPAYPVILQKFFLESLREK